MKEKILQILKDINSDITADENKDLLLNGKLDSFDVANLVAALEDEFAVEIEAEDIVPEKFSSITAIHKLIEKYIA